MATEDDICISLGCDPSFAASLAAGMSHGAAPSTAPPAVAPPPPAAATTAGPTAGGGEAGQGAADEEPATKKARAPKPPEPWLIYFSSFRLCFPGIYIYIYSSFLGVWFRILTHQFKGAELEYEIEKVEGCGQPGEELRNFVKSWITAATNANGDSVIACTQPLGMHSLLVSSHFP